ncbi:MAG: hypothetical protein WA624_00140 [Methylocella sp.]
MIFPECAAEAYHAVDNRLTSHLRTQIMARARPTIPGFHSDAKKALPEIPARILVEGMVRPGFLGEATRKERAAFA